MIQGLSFPEEFASVFERLQDPMREAERIFDASLEDELPPVESLVSHVERYRGKMLRPMLVLLCGMGATDEEDAERAADSLTRDHSVIAAVCEMVHMATLVHDDVLDEAEIRRRGETVNHLHGNEKAVILGDYLFSAAYRLCSTLDSQEASLAIGTTGMRLCSGELLQLFHRGNFSIDEATYTEIIERKTASLIGVACRLGAVTSGAHSRVCDAFEQFGKEVGMAFQIQDDLLDLSGQEAVVGKPVRRDLALGKLTLPLIHHLAEASAVTRGKTLQALHSQDESQIGVIREGLAETGSVEYSKREAERYASAAAEALREAGDGVVIEAMRFLAAAVVNRSM